MAEIINNLTEGAKSAAKYVSETVQGNAAGASAEANKNLVTSDQTTIGQKLDAAGNYVTDKKDEHSHNAAAELNKEKAKNT